MAKPKTTFIKAFEPILISAWGSYKEQLNGNLLLETQEAIVIFDAYIGSKGKKVLKLLHIWISDNRRTELGI